MNKRLIFYRKSQNLRQIDAADLLGVNRSTYIRWEETPTLELPPDKLFAIAKAFRCDPEALLDDYGRFLVSQSENIRGLRERLGLTPKELAEKLGVNVGTVRDWEAGKKRPRKWWYEGMRRLEGELDEGATG